MYFVIVIADADRLGGIRKQKVTLEPIDNAFDICYAVR